MGGGNFKQAPPEKDVQAELGVAANQADISSKASAAAAELGVAVNQPDISSKVGISAKAGEESAKPNDAGVRLDRVPQEDDGIPGRKQVCWFCFMFFLLLGVFVVLGAWVSERTYYY